LGPTGFKPSGLFSLSIELRLGGGSTREKANFMIRLYQAKKAIKKIVRCQWSALSLALGVLLLLLCGSAQAQQSKKITRIGILSGADAAGESARSEGIRLALRALGYIEGENILIEYRYAEGKPDRLPLLAAELVHLKVNIIIVSGGDSPIRAVKNATKSIPVVLGGQGSDPVEAGFVESLARPGGNVTGLTNLLVQLGDKRLELLKDAVPKLTRVSVLYVPGNRTHALELKELQTAAHALGVTVRSWEVRGAEDFDAVFAAMGQQRPDGLQMLGGPVMRANQKRIVGFTLKSRLPSVYTTKEAVDAGGLMYYGADAADGYRRIASYVDRILKGATPADLPVQQPTKFELVINLKTAKQIGLTIPANVLARADRVIR
jgi:putative ABC transport system substrate-binding protein